jgi:DNA gyrase subunit A
MSVKADAHIERTNISDVMKKKFLDYAYYVTEDRAIPDARDGLKPSQRRILFAMNELNLKPGSLAKSAKICGKTSGDYHPHGDTVLYGSLVRLAQDWVLRYPLVHGQGNWGNYDGDPPAAMRYTEASLSNLGSELMGHTNRHTVDYVKTYNEEMEEPTVLASSFPNLIVNGASGIAVGLATNMPSHNLREACELCKAYIKKPDLTTDEVLAIMPGPDFATGAKLLGQEGVRDYYESGRGSLVLEGDYEFEGTSKGGTKIVIKSLPYGTAPEPFTVEVRDLMDTKLNGIVNVTDLTERDDDENIVVRIELELAKNQNPQLIANRLLKHTSLRSTFSVNQTVIVDRRVYRNTPVLFLVETFVNHRRQVLTKQYKHELQNLNHRDHVLEGLLLVVSKLDAAIAIIRASNDPDEAISKLIEADIVKTEIQGKEVLKLRLSQLTKLESKDLLNEQTEIKAKILWLTEALNNTAKIDAEIVKELNQTIKSYGDDRRTVVANTKSDIDFEALIPDEQIIICITKDGYIKRLSSNSYKVQSRGGKGSIGVSKREDDEANHIYSASNKDQILFFTNKGLMYRKKGYEIPEGQKNTKGIHLNNLVALDAGEFVTSTLAIKTFDEDGYIIMVTKNGTIKRTQLRDFDTSLKTKGLTSIKLREGDELGFVELSDGKHDIFLVTKNGMAVRYNESLVTSVGRNSFGVSAMKLGKMDKIAKMLIVDPQEDPEILVITSRGFGKRTQASSYRCFNGRYAKGVATIDKVKADRNGEIVDACVVSKDDTLLVMTVQGKVIRVPVSEVKSAGRSTMGSRIQAVDENDEVQAVLSLPFEEEDSLEEPE